MIETLTQLDKSLFFLINGEWTNTFLDWLMPLLRNKYFWTPVYIFLVVFFLSQYKWKGFALIGFVLLAFGIADFTSASIIKPMVERSEEQTSELQSLMRLSYAAFCLK